MRHLATIVIAAAVLGVPRCVRSRSVNGSGPLACGHRQAVAPLRTASA
jgi:hypothetical protein